MGFSPCSSTKAILLASVLLLFFTYTAFAAAFDKTDIDQKLADLAAYKQGDPRKTLIDFEQLVTRSQSYPEQKIYIEKALARVLHSDASLASKEFACTQLSYIGSAESVPAIAPLLIQERTVDMACIAIAGNPSPLAAKALREALDKAPPPARIRIIDLLADRKDLESAPKIARLAIDDDKQTAQTAIAALGKIGGPLAIETIEKARQQGDEDLQLAATDAYLRCAEELADNNKPAEALAIYKQLTAPDEQPFTRAAAIRGVAAIGGPEAVKIVIAAFKDSNRMVRTTALSCVRIVEGDNVTKLFAAELPESPPAGQIMLLAALADRADPAALPEIKQTAKNSDPNIRKAALSAVAKIGGPDEVEFLAAAASAAAAEERKAAIAAISILRGDGVNRAIVAKMQKAQMPLRAELIEVLADRNAADAVTPLLKEADSEDPKLRRAAYKALGTLAGQEDLPSLLSLLVDSLDRTASRDAERAVIAAARRIPDVNEQADAVIEKLSDTKLVETRSSLLRVLGGIANKKALQQVRRALNDKDPEIQDAAVRTLAAWPDSAAAPALLEVYRDAKSPLHRTLALRGLVRLLADGKYPADKALDLLRQADKLAKDASEKKLILSGLSKIPDTQALDMALAALDDEAVKAEAALAAIKIAKAIASQKPKKAKAAAKTILTQIETQSIRKQAEQLIASIENRNP
jgi:HEAT repeat protein